MLPTVAASGPISPTGLINGSVYYRVVALLIGSALHRVSPPVSLFKRASFIPRLVSSTTMASADFWQDLSRQISSGNDVMLHRTTAAFTSTGIPDAFDVLCHLDAPCRPSIRFLFIGSRFYPSLPPPDQLPFPSWLQMVVSFILLCSGIPAGDFNPVNFTPMLSTNKTTQSTSIHAPLRDTPLRSAE